MFSKLKYLFNILVFNSLLCHSYCRDLKSSEEFFDITSNGDSSEEFDKPVTTTTTTATTTAITPEFGQIKRKSNINVRVQPVGDSGLLGGRSRYRYNNPLKFGIGNQELSGSGVFQNERKIPVEIFQGKNGVQIGSKNDIDVNSTWVKPPPHENVAQMARYIVRVSNWTSIATISSREPTVGFPFGNLVSLSDGPTDKSTGVPYMYVTGLDISSQDLTKDARASLTMSLAQTDYCFYQDFDPEDPRCARVILTGRIVKLSNDTAEFNFARQSLFSRHPVMSSWPKYHNWYFTKLDIFNIIVLDYFGGAKTVNPKDYFKAQVFV